MAINKLSCEFPDSPDQLRAQAESFQSNVQATLNTPPANFRSTESVIDGHTGETLIMHHTYTPPKISPEDLSVLSQLGVIYPNDYQAVMQHLIKKSSHFTSAYEIWLNLAGQSRTVNRDQITVRDYLKKNLDITPPVIVTHEELCNQLNQKNLASSKHYVPTFSLIYFDQNKQPPWEFIAAKITLSKSSKNWNTLGLAAQNEAAENYLTSSRGR